MLKARIVITALALFTFAPFSSADALVVCAKRNKQTGEPRQGTALRLRDVCKAAEVEVSTSVFGGSPLSCRIKPPELFQDPGGAGTFPVAICDPGEVPTGLVPSIDTQICGTYTNPLVCRVGEPISFSSCTVSGPQPDPTELRGFAWAGGNTGCMREVICCQ